MHGALNQTSCIARYCHRCVRLYIQQVSGGREPQLTPELPEINSASKAFCFLFSFPFGTQLVWQVRETSSSESGGQVVLLVLLELLLLAPLVSQQSSLQPAANLRTLRATLETSSATTHTHLKLLSNVEADASKWEAVVWRVRVRSSAADEYVQLRGSSGCTCLFQNPRARACSRGP